MIAQDQPLRIVPGETNLIFAFADLDDQIDLADAEIVARAVFEIQNFVAVDFQIFRRPEQVDGRKPIGLDTQFVVDRRILKAMTILNVNPIGLRLKQHQIRLQLTAVDLERDLLAVVHDDFGLDHILGGDRVEAEGRTFEPFDIAFWRSDGRQPAVGRRIEHELNIGDLRGVHRLGGEGGRSEQAGHHAVAQGFVEASDLARELAAAKIFHGGLFLADELAFGIGALPGDQFQRLRQRTASGGLDRHRATAHDAQALGFDFYCGLARRQIV